MPTEDRPDTVATPVPLSRIDCSTSTVAALTGAADQLREHAVAHRCGGALPAELARPGDAVTTGSLYAVAEWLEARARLYGWQPVVDVVTFGEQL